MKHVKESSMKLKYNIVGIDCTNCASKLAGIMAAKEGMVSVKINFLTEKLIVETELSESEAFAILEKCAKSFSKAIDIKK